MNCKYFGVSKMNHGTPPCLHSSTGGDCSKRKRRDGYITSGRLSRIDLFIFNV